jgi:hypothetical protein
MPAFLYLLASLAVVGILTLLADAQCHLRMSERDYGDWVALPDEARAAVRKSGGGSSEQGGQRPSAQGTSLTHSGGAE